jgi:hypothetical protein
LAWADLSHRKQWKEKLGGIIRSKVISGTPADLETALSLLPAGKIFSPEVGCLVADKSGREGTLLGYSMMWHK